MFFAKVSCMKINDVAQPYSTDSGIVPIWINLVILLNLSFAYMSWFNSQYDWSSDTQGVEGVTGVRIASNSRNFSAKSISCSDVIDSLDLA